MGILSQLLIKLPWAARVKLGGRVADRSWDGLREIAWMLPPVLLGSMAGQAKTLVDRMFASGLAEGSISYLNYASRINELPNGLLVATIVTVIYPGLVSSFNNGEKEEFSKTLTNSLNSMLFLLVPVVAGFLALATPMVELIFQRGEFGAVETIQTAYALRFYAVGLAGIGVWHLMIKGYYAQKDTLTPLLVTALTVATNTVLDYLLVGSLLHGGLALATSLSYTLGAAILLCRLYNKMGMSISGRTVLDLGKSVLAAAIMGIACHYGYQGMLALWTPAGFVQKAALTFAVIFVGMGVYFALTKLMKTQAMEEAGKLLVRAKARIKGISA